jgi:hypothetical protein
MTVPLKTTKPFFFFLGDFFFIFNSCTLIFQDRAILWGMDPESASFLLSVIGKPPLSQKSRPRVFLARKFEYILNVVVASLHRAAVTCRNRQHDWPAGPGLGKRQELDQQVSIMLHRWENLYFSHIQYTDKK